MSDQERLNEDPMAGPEGIAIIGMAGHFPGAPDVATFWENILSKRDSVTRFSKEQLEIADRSAAEQADYVCARGVLEDAAMFDAEFFGISPREAEVLDPQHRLLLEACHNALEDAGYVPQQYGGEIGLFAGCSLNTYLLANLAKDRSFLDRLTAAYQVGDFQAAFGNDKDFLTSRIAYKLNLRGPCMSVQGACATSLVAVCQASQALLNFQCDMALAGGVSITFPQHRGHLHQDGSLASRDGVCRPFDEQASGTVFGHGAGAVLLKRMEDAVRDGDHVYAVIRGFAVNNDGAAKAGYMAPSVEGQARVVEAAQAMAGFSPETITCIEAHGTGTPLGDPIEVEALTRAFRAGTARTGFCTLGTAKANVGHLDSAAGVAGLIKMALSLQHGVIPGLANFESPNPNIDWQSSPFHIVTETQSWKTQGPRRGGVSAFGVGGVNAHVVLEAAPEAPASKQADEHAVVTLSARTEAALQRAKGNFAGYLQAGHEVALADVAFTLSTGRRAFAHRLAFAAENRDAAMQALSRSESSRGYTVKNKPRIAFLFPGQGSRTLEKTRELYDREPVYRHWIDVCTASAASVLQHPLLELLFSSDEKLMRQTRYAQPALFATELAMAKLYRSWEIEPELMAGHSLGEFVAATLAEVFTPEQATRLICLRGELMQSMAPGAMLAVPLSEAAVDHLLSDEVSLAAANSPRSCVLSGPFHAIDAIDAKLQAQGIASRRLNTSHAFHSQMMKPMIDEFRAAVAAADPQPPSRPYVSTATGKLITPDEACSPAYWARHCRENVRFSAAVQTLFANGIDTLLEVGPGNALTSLCLHHKGVPEAGDFVALSSLSSRNDVQRTPAHALADLWARGADVNWTVVYAGQQRRRVSLPTYPFERRLHWVAPPAPQTEKTVPAGNPQESFTVPHSFATQTGTQVAAPVSSRRERLAAKIADVLCELNGIPMSSQDMEAQFLELGFDSLFLTQATGTLSKAFGVKLTFRQLMEKHSSVSSLAEYLDDVLPASALAESPASTATLITAPSMALDAATTDIQRILSEQLATLSQMFAAQVIALQAAAAGLPVQAPVSGLSAVASASVAAQVSAAAEVRHASFRPVQTSAGHDLLPAQTSYIESLVKTYVRKTLGSKQLTAGSRAYLADPRAVAGFRPQWKEMVYPLVTDRARGSRIWDVDGNEYIDIVNGYGCIMFGHSPEFVVQAAREQLERGVAIGPQSALAGEVASLICELTGNERVTFCNTGSEAVLAAIRVARTVTGRDRIVYFTGDYHGTFDEVLIRNTPRGSAPLAPGIPFGNIKNVTVLDYGTEASISWIREHAEEIAAVLIEPVQTRNPGLQPIEFIRNVRTITEQTGSAMILDEVVTGFRLAPGGVQQEFGVRADMCTYGKVIGGGHPIGVLSGKAQFLDALDGGTWQYGDASVPEVGVTFFAGTFVRHPLALAAARSVLRHIKQQGPELQQNLNRRAADLAQRLDGFVTERGVGCRVHSFASWFYFVFPHEARLSSLFYYSMRAKGIHIQENYPCFLTTAHSDADISAIEKAFCDSVVELQAAEILPRRVPDQVSIGVTHEAAPPLVNAPMTAGQREIYFAAALSDDANCAFNESITVKLRGSVQHGDLIRALETVIQRHDALRSVAEPGGETVRVDACFAGEIESVDLRGRPTDVQEETISARTAREGCRPFDLHRGPLLRIVCFSLSTEETVLLLVAHHMVFDGWSANQFLEEVSIIYSKGEAALSPVLPFSQFAVREQEREKAGYFADNERYWVEKFASLDPRLNLMTDRPRTALKSYKGGTISGRLTAEQRDELKQLSMKAGSTLYATLLSGFQVLLHRLTGQSEVVVGISTAGQALEERGSLIGHCVNFLPILSCMPERETFHQHLRATRTALLDAYDHQEFTYGTLLSKLNLSRDSSRLPLIEVQFNLERVGENVRFAGLTTEVRANPKRFVNTDLFLNVIETADGLEYMCDYNAELFDAQTVERWMRSWSTLLANACSEPNTDADALSMLHAGERDLVLNAWNHTGVDFGKFESVPDMFLRAATSRPSQIAVRCAGREWSYGELAEYVQLLAGRMQCEGLRPGELVGICIERSPEMVGALLATMMCGAVYVPLDSHQPRERMNMIVADAGITMLLAGRDPSVETSARILKVTGPQSNAGKSNYAKLSSNDLVYMIYTSGSTGMPKGVAIQHGALVNLLRSMQHAPGLNHNDVFLAVTTIAFDIAALELLNPLLVGAQLVIATEEQVRDGRQLLQLIDSAKVTALQATPGAWRLLLDSGWTGERPLKVLCGGEALPRELANRLTECSSDVWNMYGPTETTIWSSATRVSSDAELITLGPPIANTQFYILDTHQEPVPQGCAGELYIGGAGLADGYWKRPELTAEKFVPNPFHGGRMYRTGDLARWRGPGRLELLGRSDFQIKIRGYRIELGEIEAALARHAGISEAAVVQHKLTEEEGRNQLVAFVTTSEAFDGALQERFLTELRDAVASMLPGYMVPAVTHVLSEMPRNTNSKIDRKALEQIAAERSSGSPVLLRKFVSAETPQEIQLATIWSEVLGVSSISVTDSIFELGADSLLIFRIAARAQREKLPITATMIFQHRSLRAICSAIKSQEQATNMPRIRVPIPIAAREGYRRSKAQVDG